MRDDKSTEGFIPKGLVAGDVRGTVAGSLTIAGVVERSELKAEQLIVTETGGITNGVAEAESVVIEGRASEMTFRAGRLSAGAGARISDCIIEMTNPTGCAIDEEAHFEGDVKIAVARSRSSEDKAPAYAASEEKRDDSAPSVEPSSSAKSESVEAPHYEATGAGDKQASGAPKGSSSKGVAPEMDDAEAEVDIPLGD